MSRKRVRTPEMEAYSRIGMELGQHFHEIISALLQSIDNWPRKLVSLIALYYTRHRRLVYSTRDRPMYTSLTGLWLYSPPA